MEVSKHFHSLGIPFLISPEYLKQRNLGQVDVCFLLNNKVVVAECKSSGPFVSKRQLTRLHNALEQICKILECEGLLIVVYGFAKSLTSAYPFNIKKIGELR